MDVMEAAQLAAVVEQFLRERGRIPQWLEGDFTKYIKQVGLPQWAEELVALLEKTPRPHAADAHWEDVRVTRVVTAILGIGHWPDGDVQADEQRGMARDLAFAAFVLIHKHTPTRDSLRVLHRSLLRSMRRGAPNLRGGMPLTAALVTFARHTAYMARLDANWAEPDHALDATFGQEIRGIAQALSLNSSLEGRRIALRMLVECLNRAFTAEGISPDDAEAALQRYQMLVCPMVLGEDFQPPQD